MGHIIKNLYYMKCLNRRKEMLLLPSLPIFKKVDLFKTIFYALYSICKSRQNNISFVDGYSNVHNLFCSTIRYQEPCVYSSTRFLSTGFPELNHNVMTSVRTFCTKSDIIKTHKSGSNSYIAVYVVYMNCV